MVEKKLWEQAKERVNFKRHLITFIIVNAFFWLIWLASNWQIPSVSNWSFPWPIYPLLGWGVALAYHYSNVYSRSREKAVRREYDKLRSPRPLNPKEYSNVNLFNAAVVGENPSEAFFVENGKLHAVDARIASFKKEKSDPKNLLPSLREALKALIQFSEGKVPTHYADIDWQSVSNDPELLVLKISHIYSHLPHQERNLLSSLIHHRT